MRKQLKPKKITEIPLEPPKWPKPLRISKMTKKMTKIPLLLLLLLFVLNHAYLWLENANMWLIKSTRLILEIPNLMKLKTHKRVEVLVICQILNVPKLNQEWLKLGGQSEGRVAESYLESPMIKHSQIMLPKP